MSVNELRQRWGQRTKHGEISLHWAAFQLAPYLVDLITVHELVHLVEPQHGPAFRRLVERVLPDHAERYEELTHVGRRVWLGNIRGV